MAKYTLISCLLFFRLLVDRNCGFHHEHTVELKHLVNSSNKEFGKPQMVLQLQKPAPKFKGIGLVSGEFKEINLDDYRGQYVVLLFYPLDFTLVCPSEILEFSDRLEDFQKTNCQVIATSCDSEFCHLAWSKIPQADGAGGLGNPKIPILADKSGRIARDYEVYDEESGIPFLGLFIIDGCQILRQIIVNDQSVGRSVDETLRLVKALQFYDEHGEVCPVNSQPGDMTFLPPPQGASKNEEIMQAKKSPFCNLY